MDWRNHGLLCAMTSLCTGAVFDIWKGCVKTSKVYISSVHEGQEHSRRGSSSPLAAAGVNVTRLRLLCLFFFLSRLQAQESTKMEMRLYGKPEGSRLYSCTRNKWQNTGGSMYVKHRADTNHLSSKHVRPVWRPASTKQRRILVKALSGSHDSQSALNLTANRH